MIRSFIISLAVAVAIVAVAIAITQSVQQYAHTTASGEPLGRAATCPHCGGEAVPQTYAPGDTKPVWNHDWLCLSCMKKFKE